MSTPTPTTAYTLALVGVLFQIIGFVLIATLGPFGMWGGYGMMGRYAPMMGWYTANIAWSWMSIVWLIIGGAIVAFSIYGLRLMNSANSNSIHSGAILLLILAIIAFPTMWGLLIGSALMLAAAIIILSQHA
jgi:hypothetical protein